MFQDRAEAGRLLAERLADLKPEKPVVLAIPRGGVPVALEVSRALEAPLDLVLVRKIGAPLQQELAVAAVADGEHPQMVVNEEVRSILNLDSAWLEEEKKRVLKEIERRRAAFFADRERPVLKDRTVIVVDDGIATGATTRAVLRAVRAASPRQVVLAVPVAPPETVESLEHEVDRIVCLEAPDYFGAVSLYYRHFEQVSDDEVRRMLAGAPAG